jgi:GT2 family glycosyltransferase/glycosyltransferase involved in cell wall biosynthesis
MEEQINNVHNEFNHRKEVENKVNSSVSWIYIKPIRFMSSLLNKFFNNIEYVKTFVSTSIRLNGGIIITIKKSLRILMMGGIRAGIIQFKILSHYAKNSIVRNDEENHAKAAQIIFVSGESHTPGHNYRVINYLEAFKDIGVTASWFRPDSLMENLFVLDNAKLLIIWRTRFGNPFETIEAYARKKKLVIIYDIDDYMFDSDIAEPEIIDSIRSMHQNKKEVKLNFSLMRTAIKHSDFCTCPTMELAKALNRLEKEAFVLPNGYSQRVFELSIKLFKERNKSDNLIRIGYAGGTLTHQKDFAVALPAILLIFKEFPQTILTIFGETVSLHEFPDLKEFQDRIEIRKMVPLDILQEEISRFDINITPLVINQYCNAKSELKFFEAAILRIPTIASPTPPFIDTITNGVSGFLAYSTDDWYNYLKTLITDIDCRTRIGKNSFTFALWHFGPEQRLQILFSFLSEISIDSELQIEQASLRKQALIIQKKIKENFDIKLYSYPVVVDYDILVEYHTCNVSKAGIIVPMFNIEQFILLTLDSVKSQTLSDLDLVIIDDCSKDNSLNIALNWINENFQRFNNCAVIKNKRNSSLSAARNSGFDYIQTQFVLPLHSDIEILPEYLDKCLNVIHKSGAAIVLPQIQLFADSKELIYENFENKLIDSKILEYIQLTKENFIEGVALISKACWAKVGGYDTSLQFGFEDYDIWLRFVEHGLFAINIPEILARYRVNKHNIHKTGHVINLNEQCHEIITRHPWLNRIQIVMS